MLTSGEEAAGGNVGGLEEDGGADMTGSKYGFNLSTVTVQGLPLRDKINVFFPLCRTI